MSHGMFSRIKAERKLSFKHWRYRLLHWSFGIKPSDPCYSKLPNFFYTHYCPLFHITNALVVVSPLILLLKIVRAIVVGVCKTVYRACRLLVRAMRKLNLVPPPDPLYVKRVRMEGHFQYDFDHDGEYNWHFYEDLSGPLGISKAEMEKLWQRKMADKKAKKLATATAKKQLQERMVFWVNFSRIFLRCGLNLVSLAIVSLVGYVVFLVTPFVFGWIWFVIKGILLIDWVAVAKQAAYMSVGALILFGIFYVLFAYVLRTSVKETKQTVRDSWEPMKGAFAAFISWLGRTIEAAIEFVSMSYEDNCPPITIVEDQQH